VTICDSHEEPTAPFSPCAPSLALGIANTGLRNFHQRYKLLVNAWILYDNSGAEPVIVDMVTGKAATAFRN